MPRVVAPLDKCAALAAVAQSIADDCEYHNSGWGLLPLNALIVCLSL